MKEYKNFRTYFKEIDPENVSFESFLRRVKYAFRKILGCESVQYDMFSMQMRDGRSIWEHIKDDGECSYNAHGIAIDCDYNRVIYVETWND